MFTSVPHSTSIFFKKADNVFYMNECYIFIFLLGRKDDEMDPMDPSAYSDAPRYYIKCAYGCLRYEQKDNALIQTCLSLQGHMVKWPAQT